MARTNIGFVGAGVIASRHLGDLLDFSDVQVVALADPAIERAQELAARSGGKAYADYNEMLDKERLDAVYVCVPPFAHGPVERAIVEHDLPFFVEKPLSVDLETAETIGRQVRERNLVTAVGYHWRYLNTTEEAQELLSQKPARLALGYWLDATPPPAWWRIEAQSGGQMIEQTTHIFDLARLLVGEVDSVYASGARVERAEFPDSDVLDLSTATLYFKSGALGTMASTCILNWPHRIGLHLFCEGMAIELTEFEMIVDVGRGRPVEKAVGDPFAREDRAFIDAVQGKPNMIRSSYSDALKTHYLTTAATLSAREDRRISPDEVTPDSGEVKRDTDTVRR